MSNIIDKIQLSGVTYDIGGQGGSGVSVVEVTQAEYDALPTSAKTDTSKMYVITDAEAGDLTNYYTKSETNTLLGGKADTATTYTKTEVDTALGGKADTATTYTKTEVDNAITAATSTKQDTLVSGTNIKTINNESLLGSGNIDIQGGGGGKAIEAGRGISVTTGETADTVSFNLPIYSGSNHGITIGYSGVYIAPSSTGQAAVAQGYRTTASGGFSHSEGQETYAQGGNSHSEGKGTYAQGENSHSEGQRTYAIGENSHSEGYGSHARKDGSHAEGNNVITNNKYEHSQGQYNVSSSASTTFGDSGNTLFSVGNGTADNARHNAFEIRQNGDIYLTLDGQDVKLQDQLGGGGSSYTAGDGIDITNDVISVTGKVDTSAFTAHTADTVIHVTSAEKSTWNAKSDFSGSYNDLTNKLSAGTNITIVDNVISATGGGSITIDPTLDSGSTNPVANSAITEAVLVPSYRGLIEVQNDIAFPNATALYVENVTSGAYQDATMIEFYLSGVSEVSENILVTSFSGHTFNTEPSYMDYEWTEDNSIIFTPKTSGNYFYKIHNGWDTGFGVYVIDDYSSGSSSSVIQNEIYPRLNNLGERIDSFTDTKVTGTSYNNLYIDYGGYWYHEIEIFDNASGRFTASDKLRYNDFGYDDGIIFVKKTSGATSGSTDCITSGGVYEILGDINTILQNI